MTSPRPTRPRLLLASLAAGALLLATGCDDPSAASTDHATAATTLSGRPAGADDPALASFYGQQITWSACPADPNAGDADPTGMQCGKLHVPLDYTKPAADALDLALIRLPAAQSGQRVGSLVVNPGGPGASGVDMVRSGAKRFGGALHDRLDVVGFDPRGTGASSPVLCLDDKQRDDLSQQDRPLDPAKRKAAVEATDRAISAACQAKSGRILPFVGTRNTARDLDVLRQALGDPKLNYLGISYGTYLGALYAEEFPGKTGRLVLDGAVDPAADQLDFAIGSVIGMESSFRRFAEDCVRTHAAECPLGTDPAAAPQKLADYLEGLHDHPLDTPDGRRLNSDLGWTGTSAFLYGSEKTAWPRLREALTAAITQHRGDLLLAAADSYNGRDEQGHYDPMDAANRAIKCADGGAATPSPEKLKQQVARLDAEAPLVAKGTTPEELLTSTCANWPFKSPEKPHTVRAEGSAPILVVGTTGDPATPYAAAESLAKGFANATLLTREGEGHGAFGKGNACIDAALTAYLVSGTVPAAGTRCAG
ncbi:alpha/beta hydrolase [Kitasatospora sp. NBC_00374]|uniref:alpha/beta hydrolase n=1 Tax=Kitasatospora sp. NBC_00374 TaxID=2975964 RepID=UPI0032430FBB